MCIKDVLEFKQCEEYLTAKLTFLKSERKKLNPTEFVYYIEKQLFDLDNIRATFNLKGVL